MRLLVALMIALGLVVAIAASFFQQGRTPRPTPEISVLDKWPNPCGNDTKDVFRTERYMYWLCKNGTMYGTQL